jgi:hypothetical protein
LSWGLRFRQFTGRSEIRDHGCRQEAIDLGLLAKVSDTGYAPGEVVSMTRITAKESGKEYYKQPAPSQRGFKQRGMLLSEEEARAFDLDAKHSDAGTKAGYLRLLWNQDRIQRRQQPCLGGTDSANLAWNVWRFFPADLDRDGVLQPATWLHECGGPDQATLVGVLRALEKANPALIYRLSQLQPEDIPDAGP